MYGLRGALTASLILALQAYLILAGYMCDSISCASGAYWLAVSTWLGGVLGLLSRCRILRGYRIPVILVSGYGALAFAITLVEHWVILALLTLAALMLNTVLYLVRDESCGVAGLLAIIIGYDMLMAALYNVYPGVATVPPIALLASLLLVSSYIDAVLVEEARGKSWLIPMVLGFVFLAIAGFAAAYVSMAYRLAALRGLSTRCAWSRFCVILDSKIIPVPSLLYTLTLFLQLAYTGAILALPPRLRGGVTSA